MRNISKADLKDCNFFTPKGEKYIDFINGFCKKFEKLKKDNIIFQDVERERRGR